MFTDLPVTFVFNPRRAVSNPGILLSCAQRPDVDGLVILRSGRLTPYEALAPVTRFFSSQPGGPRQCAADLFQGRGWPYQLAIRGQLVERHPDSAAVVRGSGAAVHPVSTGPFQP